MLQVEELHAGYARLDILHGVSLSVAPGEIVALVGANGAGKSTTLRAVSGLIRSSKGTIRFEGHDIRDTRPDRIVRTGLVQVAEDRHLFGSLTVLENLRMGAYARPAAEYTEQLAEVMELFPILDERRRQTAETMSGGQQQMLAIGRALMARPRLLMLDEPSTGLSPKFVQIVLEAVQRIRDTGVPVLLVEQNATQALGIADRAYVMESGSIALSGTGAEFLDDDRVRRTYLGL